MSRFLSFVWLAAGLICLGVSASNNLLIRQLDHKQQVTTQHLQEKLAIGIGDSLTLGFPGHRTDPDLNRFTLGRPDDPTSCYGYWAGKRLAGWQVITRGIAGETTGSMLERFDRDVIAARPRYVVIIGGRNDLSRKMPLAVPLRNIAAMVARAKAHGIIPLVGCSTPVTCSELDARLQVLRSATHGWCKANGVRFIDCDAALRQADGSVIAGTIGQDQHPTPTGYRLMGEAVAAAIQAEEGR